jgi:predicted DNA-binding ribbon-helix-helix protein
MSKRVVSTKIYKPSLVGKYTIVIAGRKTSVALEKPFWDALKEIASLTERSVSAVVTNVYNAGPHSNLSSALRLFILDYYQNGVES